MMNKLNVKDMLKVARQVIDVLIGMMEAREAKTFKNNASIEKRN